MKTMVLGESWISYHVTSEGSKKSSEGELVDARLHHSKAAAGPVHPCIVHSTQLYSTSLHGPKEHNLTIHPLIGHFLMVYPDIVHSTRP
jgi:hypothetical protein